VPEIGALVMAGFDTSSHSIAWTLFTLATNAGVQARVHAELLDAGLMHGVCVCGGGGDGRRRHPTCRAGVGVGMGV
jgi:hypothetical protein